MNTSQLDLETRVKIYALEAINVPNVRFVVAAVTPDALQQSTVKMSAAPWKIVNLSLIAFR